VLRRSSTGRSGGRGCWGWRSDAGAADLDRRHPERERREKRNRKIDGPREPGRDKVGFFVLSLPFLIFLFWSLELLANFFTLSDRGTESPRVRESQVEMLLVFFCFAPSFSNISILVPRNFNFSCWIPNFFILSHFSPKEITNGFLIGDSS
jgi:hypothetical protein